MDAVTSNETHYKGTTQEPIKLERRKHQKEAKPIIGQSAYAKAFPNWKNGAGDVFYEKEPQYPYYSLPFKGESTNNKTYTDEQNKKLREHNEMLKTIGQKGAVIALQQYKPVKFESSTTN